MARRRIVVMGGAFSGPAAASRAREIDEQAEIILLERAREVSYAIGGLGYLLSGDVSSTGELNREKASFFKSVYNIDVRTGSHVEAIDARAHKLKVDGEPLAYDRLIVATGVRSPMPGIEGLQDASNVFRFRRLEDVQGILRTLEKGARRVSILGGGYFGLEAADGLLRRKCKITLIEKSPRLLKAFSPASSTRVHEELRSAGARVILDSSATRAVRRGRRVTALRVKGRKALETDLVVVCAGVQPRTEILKAAGARLHEDGSVKVDVHMATSLEDVYACGVCVSTRHLVTGKPFWLPQASLADRTAQVAGANAAGHSTRMAPVLGTSIVRVGTISAARTGWTQRESAGVARIHYPARDPFNRDAGTLSVELSYDPGSGRLLGAEVLGSEGAGADKRIDVLATAILGRLTVAQLAQLDVAYAAPYSVARDAVNVAGNVASSTREELASAWAPGDVDGKTPFIIDVRSPSERSGAPADNRATLRIPLTGLRARLAEVRRLARTQPVIFVSETGRKGYLAARMARGAGISSAGYLSGGTRSWPSS